MDKHISCKEVRETIKAAKVNKALGVDKIPKEVLKNDNTVNLLQKLFNTCFTSGIIPDCWQKSIIQPIPKSASNDQRIPTNYRGISLLSNIYKLYASIINKRLSTYLEANKKIVEEQNGFRKLRSCIDHIFTLTCVIRNRKLQGKDTYACFVDMRRAFDTVSRTGLLCKFAGSGCVQIFV
ncbi:MAG: reverse transcriptase family protein [Bacteroidetes bacterium]|nr:reverse transcriptase family protein [Bacteroidota bacterium]